MMMDEAVRILILVAMAGSACAAFVGAYALGRRRGREDAARSIGGAPVEERLARIEAIVETTALEVERVGEAQRFQARLADGTK